MGLDQHDGGGTGPAVVRAELDTVGIPASPEEVGMLVGVRQLVRSRADLLFTAAADRYQPADVFRAAGPSDAAEV